MFAKALGDVHRPREQLLLVLAEDLLGGKIVSRGAELADASRHHDDVLLLRVDPLQRPLQVVERIDTKEQDIVVMSARVSQFGAAAYDLSTEQIFSEYEQQLFSRAVNIAESFGKHVSLMVVSARDVW